MYILAIPKRVVHLRKAKKLNCCFDSNYENDYTRRV